MEFNKSRCADFVCCLASGIES